MTKYKWIGLKGLVALLPAIIVVIFGIASWKLITYIYDSCVSKLMNIFNFSVEIYAHLVIFVIVIAIAVLFGVGTAKLIKKIF